MGIEWSNDEYPIFVFLISPKIMRKRKRIIIGPLIFLNKEEYDDNRLASEKLAYCMAHAKLFYSTYGLHCIRKRLDKNYRYESELKAFAEEILAYPEKDMISKIYSTVDYMCDNRYIDVKSRGKAIVELASMTNVLDGYKQYQPHIDDIKK